jgi:hypothetical protein
MNSDTKMSLLNEVINEFKQTSVALRFLKSCRRVFLERKKGKTCFFCGARTSYENSPIGRGVFRHDPNCLYIRIEKFLEEEC